MAHLDLGAMAKHGANGPDQPNELNAVRRHVANSHAATSTTPGPHGQAQRWAPWAKLGQRAMAKLDEVERRHAIAPRCSGAMTEPRAQAPGSTAQSPEVRAPSASSGVNRQRPESNRRWQGVATPSASPAVKPLGAPSARSGVNRSEPRARAPGARIAHRPAPPSWSPSPALMGCPTGRTGRGPPGQHATPGRQPGQTAGRGTIQPPAAENPHARRTEKTKPFYATPFSQRAHAPTRFSPSTARKKNEKTKPF